MATKKVQKLFTPSQVNDINSLLGEITKFTSKELQKIKKAEPFTAVATPDGFEVGYYKIRHQSDLYLVSTQSDATLAEFVSSSLAVLYCCLLVKKLYPLTDRLSSLSTAYIISQNEFNVRSGRIAALKPKTPDEWWKYDLYANKLNEAKVKLEIAKNELRDFTKHNAFLKKLKTNYTLD